MPYITHRRAGIAILIGVILAFVSFVNQDKLTAMQFFAAAATAGALIGLGAAMWD